MHGHCKDPNWDVSKFQENGSCLCDGAAIYPPAQNSLSYPFPTVFHRPDAVDLAPHLPFVVLLRVSSRVPG